ncbi:MAG: MBL fold metallo-hydrolase [Gammaproteobacteria bacterium]|nr:MAG: MBL fold metallo-hydrolase [Gammaproteobacteria bacterium]
MQIEFYGASNGKVTGSCHILRYGGKTVLFDCGMIQGGRKAMERNRDPFPFDAASIDAVILSHAHIDHCGRLPLLVKRGFSGTIHTQNASVELCEILLKDSAKLAGYDAGRYNRKHPNEEQRQPLFTDEDVENTMRQFVGHRYQESFEPLPGLTITLQDAGHILGSAMVEAQITEGGITKKMVFSGDIGQFNTPILQDPTMIESADVVLMESTYGGRRHRERKDTITEIGDIIRSAKAEQGNIVIPAFSIGRSQELLYHFVAYFDEWELGDWRIYLDSPMAIEASKIYWEFKHLHDNAAKRLLGSFGDKIPLPNYQRTVSADESKRLNEIASGAIFIAGSGMCNGGRIVHHLRHNLCRPESHILIVGYQANGTLGRRLVNGEKHVKIFGEWIPVNAHIHTVGGLSAHADQEDLLRWLKGFKTHPRVYLVHGERDSQDAFIRYAGDKTELTISHPDNGETIDLRNV